MDKLLASSSTIALGIHSLRFNSFSLNKESVPLSKFVRSKVSIRCESDQNEVSKHLVDRRQALIGLGSVTLGVSYLESMVNAETANAGDIIQRGQRSEYLALVKGKLSEAIAENKGLIPSFVLLALSDAATYDKATKTGGANGSIRFNEELERPENAKLKKVLDILENVKADLDKDAKGGPISYADLIQFGGRLAISRTFLDAAIAKAGGDEKKGRQLYAAFGSSGQWSYFDKQLGRADAEGPDPAGLVPVWETASVSELKAKFEQLGFKARQLALFSAFLGDDLAEVDAKLATDPEVEKYVNKYQRSKESVSQTDYEVDLITTFTKLSQLGAKIDYEAYTYALPRPKFKF